VSRTAQPEMSPVDEPKQAMPTQSLGKVASRQDSEPEDDTPARGTAQAAAAATFGAAAGAAAVAATAGGSSGGAPGAGAGGLRALIQYDYEKAEDNEIELVEGQYVTNIEQVDDDWWMGTNSKGESGLFPSNYVELVDDEADAPAPPPAPVAAQAAAPAPPSPPPAAAQPSAAAGKTATAQYDYEAAEDNELSFPDGAKIMNVEFPDEDWWFGEYGGKSGLFPANYVQLDD